MYLHFSHFYYPNARTTVHFHIVYLQCFFKKMNISDNTMKNKCKLFLYPCDIAWMRICKSSYTVPSINLSSAKSWACRKPISQLGGWQFKTLKKAVAFFLFFNHILKFLNYFFQRGTISSLHRVIGFPFWNLNVIAVRVKWCILTSCMIQTWLERFISNLPR